MTMDEAELKKIVDRAQKRDLAAISCLYEAYYTRVYRYILIRVRNVTEAEDLASQTFLKMVERIDSFRWPPKGGGFPAWLFKIAQNSIIDWFRGSKTTVPLLEKDEPEGRSPEEMAAEDESVRGTLKALGYLSDDQRQVLLLRLVGGLSSSETAAVVGTTAGNVRSLQHRALNKGRERLEVIANA